MKISVILTSYNHEKFLKESIESVINQTYRDFELIVVDDCSTDSSWSIIETYKKKYPDIVILRHEYNWSGGTVEDTVKKYATGDYIAIHHSDDIWEPTKLERQVAVFGEHPDFAAVFTNASAIDEDGNPYEDKNGFYYNLFDVSNRSRYEWLNHFFFRGNCLCHPSILVKKQVYMEDGFFRKGLRQIPDFIKWIQICKKHEIYVLPEVLVKFRVHTAGQNTSGMRADSQIRSTIELFLMLWEYLDIADRQEFLAVFPAAKKYCTEDFFSTEYVLGRICTEEGMPPYTRLFGIQLLYKALNDEDIAYELQRRHSYSASEFSLANGRYDIFGLVPVEFEQTRSLYYDCGNGYNPGDVVREKYTLGQELVFHMHAELQTRNGDKIKRLRFDPAEGVLVRTQIESITVEGEKIDFAAENALEKIDGNDFFVNLDPIYELTLPSRFESRERLNVEIKGRVERMTESEIGSVVTGFMYEQRDILNEYISKLKNEEEKYGLTLLEKEKLAQIYKTVADELARTLEAKRGIEQQCAAVTDELGKVLEDKRYVERQCAAVTDELGKALEHRRYMEQQHTTVTDKLVNLENDYATVSGELQRIKNTRWYRLWKKVHEKAERRRNGE